MRRHAIRWAAALVLGVGATRLPHAQAADDPVFTPREGWLPVPAVRAPEAMKRQEDATVLLRADASAAVVGVRVVDERTRAPIAGAKLTRYRVSEDMADLRAPFHAGEATSGKDGIVSLPMDRAKGGWWVVEATGYAPFQADEVPPVEVGMRPGRRVEARLLDPMGAPLADAEVLVFHGGEWPAPVLARARTAADGRLVLEHVDVAHGCYAVFGRSGVLGYTNSGDRYQLSYLAGLGRRVRDVALEPGIDVRGRVLDERGAPLQGAIVGTNPEGHDGQAAPVRTNATGDFEVLGVRHGSALLAVHPAATDDGGTAFGAVIGDAPALVRVGPDGDPTDYAAVAAASVRVDLELRVPSGRSLGKVELRAVGDDGRAFTAWTQRGYGDGPLGTALFSLPPGHYRVTTGDRFQRVAIPRTEFTVSAASPITLKVRSVPQPALRTVGLADGESATLVIPGQQTGVSTELGALQGTWLPSEVPAWVEWRGFRFPVSPEQDGERVATIVRPAPTIVRWSADWPVDKAELLLDDRGVEADAHPFEQHVDTYATGPVILRVALDLQGTIDVPIELPAEVGSVVTVDLGPAYRARSQVAEVRVQAPDDGPSLGMRAWADFGPPDGVVEFDRPLHPFEVGVPSRVLLESSGVLPMRLAVTAPGPRSVAWGKAALELAVTGPAGEPLDAVASIDGHLLRIDAGSLTVGGLGEGPHAVLVSSRATANLRAVETTIALGATETRRLQVRLPAR